MSAEREVLERTYQEALDHEGDFALGEHESLCATFVENQQKARGALAVIITLLVKKACDPDQDIRMHQRQLPKGFNARGLDTRVVTPFLKEKNFPFMKGGTGWGSKSFEMNHAYTLDYPKNFKPVAINNAFLRLVDAIERSAVEPGVVLKRILVGLIEHRDRRTDLRLSRPVNQTVEQIANSVNRHFSESGSGASKLPVISVHALMSLVVPQMKRYQGCIVPPLQSHTAADSKSGNVGDVSIAHVDGAVLEAFEIKLGQQISQSIVGSAYDKFKTESIRRYYILTTHPDPVQPGVGTLLSRILQEHGCQVIVNGVIPTIRYYLRLVQEPDRFIDQYVSEVEADPELSYDVKIAWNAAVEQIRRSPSDR